MKEFIFKKNLNKGLALILLAVMLISLLPTTISLAGTVDTTLDFSTADKDISGDGYAWNNADSTLTLNNLDLNVTSGNGIVLPDGATIVLNDKNEVTTAAGSVISSNGSLKINGGGTLIGKSTGKSDDYHGIETNGGNLEIGECKLDLNITPDWVTEVITTVEYQSTNGFDKGGALTLKSGANVTVGDNNYRSWGVCTGKSGYKNKACGDLTIEEGATLKVNGLMGFYAGYGCNVTINGTFDTSGCDKENPISANVMTYEEIKINGTVKMAEGQYMDTRGEKLTINAKADSTGSIFNPGLLSAWIFSNKRGFDSSWAIYCNQRYSLKHLYVAKDAIFTIVPNGEITESDMYQNEVIVEQTLKLAPEALSDLSGEGYVKIEDGANVELTFDGATVNQVQALNLFCGKVTINSTEVSMHAGGTATCKDKAVCGVCNQSYGELNADNHTGTVEWIKTETEHTQKYNCCGAVVIQTEKHAWKDGVCEKCGYVCTHSGGIATCKDKAACGVCNQSYGELNADNHTGTVEWIKTETEHTQKYNCCGAVVIQTEKHTWKDGVCEKCGYICTHSGGSATCKDKAKCTFCGEEYGELNLSNHTKIEKINAKTATKTSNGNIEYWHCNDCGKYFKDAECTTEIKLSDTAIKKIADKTQKQTKTDKILETPDNTKSPRTNDLNNLFFYFSFLILSGAIVIKTCIDNKMKQKEGK